MGADADRLVNLAFCRVIHLTERQLVKGQTSTGQQAWVVEALPDRPEASAGGMHAAQRPGELLAVVATQEAARRALDAVLTALKHGRMALDLEEAGG